MSWIEERGLHERDLVDICVRIRSNESADTPTAATSMDLDYARDLLNEWLAEHAKRHPSPQVVALIRDFVDPDECWFDHHGGCQAHGHLGLEPGELCPHAEAKQLLAQWDKEDGS